MPAVVDPRFAALVARYCPELRLVRTWALTGGSSAQVTALELESPDGSRRRLIVRQHGAADRARNPRVAAAEFRLLELLQAEGIPAPVPRWLDESCTILPLPYLVCDYVTGAPDFTPADCAFYCAQFATTLARIHAIKATRHDLSFLPSTVYPSALPARNQPVLLHGDFWPGNVIWHDGLLAGVIDWEDAMVGDPIADVANTRMELWAHSDAATHAFTRCYRELTGSALDWADLPHWDLIAAQRATRNVDNWSLSAVAKQSLRDRIASFTAMARAGLPRPS